MDHEHTYPQCPTCLDKVREIIARLGSIPEGADS